MINGISAALSGLTSLQKKNESIANNTANVNTDGYKKTRVTLQEELPQGVSTNVSQIDTPGPMALERTTEGEVMVEQSNVDLGEEIPQQLLTKRFFQANLKTIQVHDEMLGSLIDIRK